MGMFSAVGLELIPVEHVNRRSIRFATMSEGLSVNKFVLVEILGMHTITRCSFDTNGCQLMPRSNCSDPIPLGYHFFCLPRSTYNFTSTLSRPNQSLHFPVPRPLFTSFSSAPPPFHFIFQCPALFLTPGMPVGDGVRAI